MELRGLKQRVERGGDFGAALGLGTVVVLGIRSANRVPDTAEPLAQCSGGWHELIARRGRSGLSGGRTYPFDEHRSSDG